MIFGYILALKIIRGNFMSGYFLSFVKGSVRLWFIPLVVGILFVLLGVISFINPSTSLFTLGILFSLTFMIGGVFEMIFSLENRFRMYNWGWKLVMSILTFMIGLLLYFKPEISILTLSLYVGFLILFRSFAAISFAMDFRRYANRSWLGLLVFGILGVLAAFFLLWNPIWVAIYTVILLALNLSFAGIFSIYYGLELRKIKKVSRKMSPEIRDRINQLKQDLRNENF